MNNRTVNLYLEVSTAGAVVFLRNNGYTMQRTADILNENAVLSTKGRHIKWTPQRVAKIEKDFEGLDCALALRAMELVGLDLDLEVGGEVS